MKECKNIMLYLAGELNPQEESAFKRHLAECRACRTELTLWQAAQEQVQAPAAPAPVVEALFAKTTRKPKLWQAFFRPAWVACALAAVLVAGGLMWQERPGYDSREVMAYMNTHLEEDYQTFALDLAQLEAEF